MKLGFYICIFASPFVLLRGESEQFEWQAVAQDLGSRPLGSPQTYLFSDTGIESLI